MHPRIIKLVSPSEVHVKCHAELDTVVAYLVVDGEFDSKWINYGITRGDKLGVEAGQLVRQCWLDTGDFAALSDESAIPFVGKEIKVEGKSGIYVVRSRRKGFLCIRKDNDEYWGWYADYQLLPLVVKPTPPSADELAEALDKVIKGTMADLSEASVILDRYKTLGGTA